ncbi:MAG: hypothetical protein FWD34_08815 [Oscillospiraceae bacterium]|nr:hypothetical protein [Oscillospiraceae bacterium]
MKKKLLAIILAMVMLIGVAACTATIPNNDDDDETKRPKTSEEADGADPLDLDEAFQSLDLNEIIMSNKSAWERDFTLGGTLLDLDFCGTPEFLVLYGDGDRDWVQGQSVGIYKIENSGLNFLAEITANVFTGADTPNRHISLYTDGSGKKSWAIPYQIVSGNTTEFRFGLFDFTGGSVTETVKFSSIMVDEEWDSTKYYENGQEFALTDEDIRLYAEAYARYEIELEWYERDPDDYLANSAQEFYSPYDGMFESQGVNLPQTAWIFDPHNPLHSNATEKWHIQKYLFELSLIPTSYKLDPNRYWDYDWENDIDNAGLYWFEMSADDVDLSIAILIGAYTTKNTDYLMDEHAYSLGAMAKPVIYLYPEEVTDVNVRVYFPHGGFFTCTYPEYGSAFGDGWNVTAYPNGTLINHADNHEYSYLYWEGEDRTEWDFSEGFVVKGKDTAKFLQEKLAYLGMIPREYNEFIVYWLPLMQNNEYNLITFQTDLYEDSAWLFISPEPDSMLRVFMAYKPLDGYIDIPEQQLQSFERTGFAVIEWGGVEVN